MNNQNIRANVRQFVEYTFYLAVKQRYANPFKINPTVYLSAKKIDNDVHFSISDKDDSDVCLMMVSSDFLNNSKLIMQCEDRMSTPVLEAFHEYVDFLLDHDTYRHDLQKYMLQSLHKEAHQIYDEVTDDVILEHISSRNMQILVETYTNKSIRILKSEGYIND